MKQYDKDILCELYRVHGKLRIVAKIVGCSDETVRRALIKNNIPRVVHKIKKPVRKKGLDPEEIQQILKEYYGTNKTINEICAQFHRAQYVISRIIKENGDGLKENEHNRRKITDQELIEESKILNCREIAKKHGMSEERVFRRARKIGIKIRTDKAGGHWIRRSLFYGSKEFDETITLKSVVDRFNGVCQICGEPIDWNDLKDGHIRRKYPTVDHIIPLSKGGSHTWNNIQLAHMACNAGKCDRTS